MFKVFCWRYTKLSYTQTKANRWKGKAHYLALSFEGGLQILANTREEETVWRWLQEINISGNSDFMATAVIITSKHTAALIPFKTILVLASFVRHFFFSFARKGCSYWEAASRRSLKIEEKKKYKYYIDLRKRISVYKSRKTLVCLKSVSWTWLLPWSWCLGVPVTLCVFVCGLCGRRKARQPIPEASKPAAGFPRTREMSRAKLVHVTWLSPA